MESNECTDNQTNNEDYKNYEFVGSTYIYTDEKSNVAYVWNTERNQWEVKGQSSFENTGTAEVNKNTPLEEAEREMNAKNSSEDEEEKDSDDENTSKKPQVVKQDLSKGYYGFEGDTHTYTDPNDGTVYFWDKERKAWFPKIDDTFIAYYQMNYGFNQSDAAAATTENKNEKSKTEDDTTEKKESKKESLQNLKRKIEPEPPKWFNLDDQHNTKVYVSNLPLDITETEFVDLMQKCGLVMKDLDGGKMKIKLYSDPITKNFKGDALCTYIKKESVDLALNLLDDYEVRGKKIKVERARFTMKGDSYDPNLKPKKKRKKDREKMKKIQERLFAWQPDKLRGERSKHECVVVIKNLFDPSTFDENLGLIAEYREDIKEECSKCGAVKKVVIYDKHKDGVAQVWFKEAEEADACVQLLNNRWFGQRLIAAETWDGKAKYKVRETEEEAEARLKKWEAFLNTKGDQDSKKVDPENDLTQTQLDDHENQQEVDSNGTRSSAGSGDDTEDEADHQ